MYRFFSLSALVLAVLALISLNPDRASAQVNVTTWHNDNQHTGQNLQETILTPANVNPTKFGKLFSYPVDGQMYAQPLYVQGVTIGGVVHNVVYAATENNSVYAFDADSATNYPNPLWHVSYTNKYVVPVPCLDNQIQCNIYPIIGISGTPVINLANNTMYLVARTKETSPKTSAITYAIRLHALNIATGAEQPHSPMLICSAKADGGCSLPPYTSATIFEPEHQMQRPALLFEPLAGTAEGVVYVPFGGDRGWILAFDAQTLQLIATFCSSPNVTNMGHGLSGFWGSGGAVAADTAGNLYAATADGLFDVPSGGSEYGDAVIKLNLAFDQSTNQYQFSVLDYFSPVDQTCRYQNDVDLGSGAPMLLPPQPGANPNLLFMSGKGIPACDPNGTPIFLVNADNMGQTSGSTIQTLNGPVSGYWSGPAYWQSATATYVYDSGLNYEAKGSAGDYVRAYSLVNGVFSPSVSVSQSPGKLLVGSTPSISANGTTNGILWASARTDLLGTKPGSHPAVLYAYDATNLGKQLYASSSVGTRDQAGPSVKFVVPTIANGKVYVGTQTELDVYGLLAGSKK